LEAYATSWLAGIRGQVRPRTFDSYEAQLRLHVLPQLGGLPIGEIDVDDLLALIGGLTARGYTGWSVRTTMTPLSRALSHAVRRGVIATNPVNQLERTERPAVWRSEQRVLNSEEIARLLDAATTRYRTLLAAAIFSGLRQGELLGLMWQRIDFEGGVIKVRSALDRAGKLVPPKTRNARRDVVLVPGLARALATHRVESRFASEEDFVFASQVGTPLHWRNVARRALQPALKDAGLGSLRWHDLRHSYAALMIASGANIAFVSRMLGHADPYVTLRVYGHLFDQMEHAQRARETLEATFGAIISPVPGTES
jgi:integrase